MSLKGKKIEVLGGGFVQLVDWMGNDETVVKAARKSYTLEDDYGPEKARNLIRYLMRHRHTTPTEMPELMFLVRVPMDTWRQWIRHRTASVNEYSTRYSEAVDEKPADTPFRLQSKDSKQGSDGLMVPKKQRYYAESEKMINRDLRNLYNEALSDGMAKEQARRMLPLSTWTEAMWKIDLHNLFHFLKLRLDSHAQFEIRQYAEAIASIVKELFPISYQAFEDYVLNAITFSKQEQEQLYNIMYRADLGFRVDNGMTKRELAEFKEKLERIVDG